jgi:hypothetical protein
MTRPVGENDRLTPCEQVHARSFDGELVILDLRGGDYYALDAVGARIWEGYRRGETAAEIGRQLTELYAIEYARAVSDCVTLANELVGRKLLRAIDP